MKRSASKPTGDASPELHAREQREFAARIAQLVDLNGGPTAFARLIGGSYSGVRSWMEGKADPSRSFMNAMSRACGVRVSWLSTGEGPMRLDEPEGGAGIERLKGRIIRDPGDVAKALGAGVNALLSGEKPARHIDQDDEFVFVRRYDVRAAGGRGEFISDENVIGRYAYQREWWERNMRVPAAKCAIIDYVGDSMEPDLHDGEPLMIDLSDNGMNADAVYVFRLDDRLLVKRLQWLPGDLVNVHSSNPRYPAFQVSMADLQSPERGQIIGRVLGVPGDFRWIK